ncbi:hypothetical protein [Staphylospora marina]|uniref:hypothetical protein n=1 Tax=Staphylospora marina TaxID=2490858 RepID=UPI000F5BFF83|nr:hypothetical protein [Staphylospora marina]
MHPRTRNALIAWTVIFFALSWFLLYWMSKIEEPPNALAVLVVVYGITTIPVGFHATFKGIGKILSFLFPGKSTPEPGARVEVKVEYRHPDAERIKVVFYLVVAFFIFWVVGILGPLLFPYYIYLFKKSFDEAKKHRMQKAG